MHFLRNFFNVCVLALLLLVFGTSKTKAAHIIGGDIYWECVTTGPDAGKFVFFLKLYRDCSIPGQTINPNDQRIIIDGHPDYEGQLIDLNLVSEGDVNAQCGISCTTAGPDDTSIREYVFSTAPMTLNGVPPADGYRISFFRCCRNPVDNIVDAFSEEIRYTATMYPYNGQDMFPCYDSSPQFAEKPTSILCSGYQFRYNSNATDANADSLSYELVDALGAGSVPVQYAPGYSATNPVPGPDQLSFDPITGQMNYDSPANLQGTWTIVAAVYGWRCGQLISKTIREMSMSLIPCSEPNNVPQVSAPVWTAPAGATDYSITVNAGDPVSFSISGTDNDLTLGVPQQLEFSASGDQFDASVTGAAGCIAPCATLSNVTPPATGVGTISTEFNWQTTCDHVASTSECATLSTTHNFIFKYQDDFCPTRGFNIVNVAVTVLGEPVVESPDPHCASTAANGDITLTWETVTDNAVPPSFVEYAIFHSTSPNGPFQEIGTVPNIATNTYTHTAANPTAPPITTGANYYHIRTRSGCNDSELEAPVDDIASIFLTVTDNTTTADLAWNALATPPLSSSNTQYDIWRLEPMGAWTQIGSTSNLFYTDPVVWCANELITYRIELTDNLGCVSVSNEVSENLDNPLPPDPQAIDSVSVDKTTGLAVVGWSPNGQPNVVEYIVELNPDLVAWGEVHTAVGYTNTSWINPASNASTQSEYYRVKATNDCGNGVTGTPVGFHRTIFLEVEADGCTRTSTLNWNEYEGWTDGVLSYDVFASVNGAPATWIGQTADTVLTFEHTGLAEGAVYCYCVRATQNASTAFTSTSNEACDNVYIPKRPEYDYNYLATVQPGNTGIEDYFYCDNTAGYLGFDIQRGTDPNSLSTIWFVPFDLSTNYYDYTDPGARPESQSYYYSIIGIDSCDLYADTMNMARTVYLEVEPNTDRTNSLQWNAYEGWLGGVTAYNIYRSYNGPFVAVATVPASQLTYLDSIEDIIIGEGKFCYYVEAVEGIGTPVGPVVAPPSPILFEELSRSNEACAQQHPNVFMPNAFMPDGINRIFKPVSIYVQANTYLFQIYNRWGQRLFETNNPEEGWDGSYGGKKAAQGAYVYYVQFVSSDGQTYSKNGSVTLIR